MIGGKPTKLEELAMWMSVEAIGIGLDRSIAQGILSLAGAGPVRSVHVEQALAYARDAGMSNLDDMRVIGELILRFEASRGATYEGALDLSDVATTPRTVTGHDDIALVALDEPTPEAPDTLDPDAEIGPTFELARGTSEGTPVERIARPDDILADGATESLELAPDAQPARSTSHVSPAEPATSPDLPTTTLSADAAVTGTIPTLSLKSSKPASLLVQGEASRTVDDAATAKAKTKAKTTATANANGNAVPASRRAVLVVLGVLAVAAAAVVALTRGGADPGAETQPTTSATGSAGAPDVPTIPLKLGAVELRATDGWRAGSDIAYRGNEHDPDESMIVTTGPLPPQLAVPAPVPAALLAATRTATRGVATRLSRDGAQFELAGCGLLPGKTTGTCRGVASIDGVTTAIDTYLRIVDGKAVVAIVEAKQPRPDAHREAAAMIASIHLTAR